MRLLDQHRAGQAFAAALGHAGQRESCGAGRVESIPKRRYHVNSFRRMICGSVVLFAVAAGALADSFDILTGARR